MKNIKFLLCLLLPATAFLANCGGQNGYTFSGNIVNSGNLQVLLEQTHFDRSNTALGKAACDATGNFKIETKEPFAPGLYRLSIGAKRLFFVLDGKEKNIEIKGDLSTVDKMAIEVKGSEALACMSGIVQDLFKNPLSSPEQARAVIGKGCGPLMQAFLTMQLLGNNAGSFLADFKTADQKLSAAMPGSKYALDYTNMVASIENQMAESESAERIKVGQEAPDISLPGPDGKVRTLSSLRGKIVLLDFWASWCGPCRRENPRVVETYKKFKPKGFEIFSVSLDGGDPRRIPADQLKSAEKSGREKWIAAIKQDGLVWDNHVSDLKHWGSAPAAVYGVTGIPKTFLIGRDGKIVAINPRQNLEEALQKAL
jgi:thiol-disulfide isomerase/thioredoxin